MTRQADARNLPLADRSVDLVVTSPPYWRKRDYGHPDQIGQEATPFAYAEAMAECLTEWRRVLRPKGSVFLNVGDTYLRRSLAGVPALVEAEAIRAGWLVRNRIVWRKRGGIPDPARDRLASRYEYILHLTPRSYFYDLFGYSEAFGNGANPGDVWEITPQLNAGQHLAPFPEELVERAIVLACPTKVCAECGQPRERITQATSNLNMDRPQARRAVELAQAAGLTEEHFAAIRATGISDAGKALHIQTGTGRNAADVQQLAAEAKSALGGYFREYTMGKRETVGWTDCECADYRRGAVLDPFAGTGTTERVAARLNRIAIGFDLVAEQEEMAA